MSNLVPAIMALDKGLNLQTAKLVAPPGSVLDTLNYEQVDFQGQKRIDGFARYDGSLLPALDEYYVIVLTDPYAGTNGDLVATSSGLLGVVGGVDTNTIYVAIINYNLVPAVTDTIYRVVDGANVNGNVVTAISTGTLSGVTVDQHYTNLLAYTQALRDRVKNLPGPIAGLHWFRDRLYAVASVTVASLHDTTPIIYPNDVIAIGSSTSKVLDAFVMNNTRLVFLDALDPTLWTTEGEAVTRNSISVGTIANGYEFYPVSQQLASLFQARSEAQVLAEDSGPYTFGWKFIDQGWKINFKNGVSLFGSLPSLNQNIVGLGTQGPTPITGDYGRPTFLAQAVAITDKIQQVNGWKSSNSPTIYELVPSDVATVDTNYTYADAYIQWNGTTGEVSAPGYTDTNLIEYSAINTVILG